MLNEPAKVLQSKIQLVEHPVGAADPSRRVAGSHGRPSGGLLSYAASTPRISAAGWLEEVEQHGEPELQAFARNLHKEESAVQAGLILAWSNGPTEGFIHRLKLLKRQAYGRAGVALLKQRMLFHPSDLIAA